MISRQEAEQLIGNEEGNFLVRESNNPPSSYTLAIKFVSLFQFNFCLNYKKRFFFRKPQDSTTKLKIINYFTMVHFMWARSVLTT
jgi:hypothetical protein